MVENPFLDVGARLVTSSSRIYGYVMYLRTSDMTSATTGPGEASATFLPAPRASTISDRGDLADPDPAVETTSSPVRRRRPALSWMTAGRWLALAIIAVLVIGMAVEPSPNGSEPVAPLWVDVIANTTVVAIYLAIFALAVGLRWGPPMAVATAAGLLILAATCPLSGHHTVGWYTYVQLVLSAALLVAATAVARGRRSR